MSRVNMNANEDETVEPIPVWEPRAASLPTDPTIKIFFTGLMVFCHNATTREAEVGVHNSAGHLMRVVVCEDRQLAFHWTGHAATISNNSYFVRASGQQIEPPGFYQPDPSFDRNSPRIRDFRWIVDLENSEFYGYRGARRRLPKVPGIVRPRLLLNTGVFYTAHRTRCSFKRDSEPTGSSVYMGQVADVMGANIVIGPNSFADVTLPGGYSARLTSAKKYDIIFANTCDRAGCEDDGTGDPLRQNDFHHYLSTFRRNPSEPRLHLKLAEDCPPVNETESADFDFSDDPCILDALPESKRGSDRAPCAAAGFGDGGGLG